MSLKAWVITTLMFLPALAAAQVDEALEQLAAEDGETTAQVLVDELNEMRDLHTNINDTAALFALPLLSPFQQRALTNYIVLYGQLLSHKELALIPGFDSTTVALLSELTVVEPYVPNRRLRLADGSHSLMAGVGGYGADSLRALTVYNYNLGHRVSLRLVAEKDAGEGWGKDNFYGYHLMLSDMGVLERMIAGRYSLRFGQGLTLWTGLAPFDIIGVAPQRFGAGIRPASTFYEEGYQEGLALTLRLLRDWRVSAFVSKAQGRGLTGGHVEYRSGNLVAGMTLTYTTLDSLLDPTPRIYNRDYFRGDRLLNAGADVAWQWRRLMLYGEAAVGDSGVAAIAGAQMLVDSRNSFAVSYRHYDVGYHNLNACPYGIGDGRNEQGWTLDARLRLPLKVDALLSADMHRFPSLRYGSYRPSGGEWLRVHLGRQLGKAMSATVRYSYRRKERNVPNIDSTTYLWEETARRQLQGELRADAGRWRLVTKAVWASFDSEEGVAQSGWMLSQQARYSHRALQATAAVTLFDVDGYYARIYSNESNLQYFFTMPAYQGKGVRAWLVMRYAVSDRLSLAAKYVAQWKQAPVRHHLTLQLRWTPFFRRDRHRIPETGVKTT